MAELQWFAFFAVFVVVIVRALICIFDAVKRL